MSDIKDIATEISHLNENIVLIYAFNATGKTRLSVAYKDVTKAENDDQHIGVYYNAYSEDLFDWDNDEENNNDNIRLNIKASSLNKHYSLLTEENIQQELSRFNTDYQFRFNAHSNPEMAIESITFFLGGDDDIPIKISRGEERIFVWCFFLALFKVEGWIDSQNAHFFIDDPVSSLDDNNIFLTADTIMQLLEENFANKKIILTTHHIGLFSILHDYLMRGEKSGGYRPNSKFFILKKHSKELALKEFTKEVFLFHLHLLQVLYEAKKEKQLFTYHFVLLRQLLENIVSFLGTSQITFLLKKIGVDSPEESINMLNSLSHKRVFIPQFNEMNERETELFTEIFDKLLAKYNFRL